MRSGASGQGYAAMNLEQQLLSLVRVHPIDGGWAVDTTCLLPTGEVVTVTVRGGDREATVSDDGLAVAEIENVGADLHDPDRSLRRYASRYGVNIKNGQFFLRVPTDEAGAAVMLVANAVSDAVSSEISKARLTPVRDIRKALSDFLRMRLPQLGEHKDRLAGKYATHEFQHVYEGSERKRKLIVDAVLPEPSSINSRIVAHIDVKQEYGHQIDQYIVFDDTARWTTDKLGLMQLAASLVPFSQIDQALIPRLGRFH